MNAILLVLLATGFTFLMTTLGSACVFLFSGEIKGFVQRAVFGFAAGVMLAASAWSMLIPAIDMAIEQGESGVLQATGGFVLGGAFLLFADWFLSKAYYKSRNIKQDSIADTRRTALLFGTITLHNIPEGMAVGLACMLAAQHNSPVMVASAATLAIGIGLQNFPEGAAVSLPFRQEGKSRVKSFVFGALSGIVEPIGGVVAVLIAGAITPLLPWLLSFAAGAMVYAVAAELIPQSNKGGTAYAGVAGVIIGFAFMMTLDVALG